MSERKKRQIEEDVRGTYLYAICMTPLDNQEHLHLKAYTNYILIQSYYIQLRKNGTVPLQTLLINSCPKHQKLKKGTKSSLIITHED